MLHGKHVMVRVGGGWDTLRGFLTKYDPLRVLQFTTLEQKILAFQKGPPGLGGHHHHGGAAAVPPPPDMDPLAAVNDLISSSSSSSSSTSSLSSSANSACKPPTVQATVPACRSYTPSPACTPTLPRKCSGATPTVAAKKALQMTPSSPRKPTQLPLPTSSKGSSSLPSTPLGGTTKQPPSPVGPSAQVHRRALTPSSSVPNQGSKLKARPSPSGPVPQPRSPVCPEPSSKCPKPSSPTNIPTPSHTLLPRPITAPKDGRPPAGSAQRSRLAQRRPGSPASRLRLEAARRVRAAAKAAATPALRAASAPQTRAPTPTSRTTSPALPKRKEVAIAAKGPPLSKVAAAPQVPGSGTSVGNSTHRLQRVGRPLGQAMSKIQLSPGPNPNPQIATPGMAAVKGEPESSKKAPQCKGKGVEPYFEMNSRRKQRT